MVWLVGCSNGTGKVKEQQVCLSAVGHECSLVAGSCCVLKRKLLLLFCRGREAAAGIDKNTARQAGRSAESA